MSKHPDQAAHDLYNCYRGALLVHPRGPVAMNDWSQLAEAEKDAWRAVAKMVEVAA